MNKLELLKQNLYLLDKDVSKNYEIIIQNNHKIMVAMGLALAIVTGCLIYVLYKYDKLSKKQNKNKIDIYD